VVGSQTSRKRLRISQGTLFDGSPRNWAFHRG
jgi:hypothetical protein